MRWEKLAFLHWPVAPGPLRTLLPSGLELETFEGRAWVGVTPFRMNGVRARLAPPLPWVSAFPELNVRTYAMVGGKPGVWFMSLDAGNPLAVRAARLAYGLPYFHAEMSMEEERSGRILYRSRRRSEEARFEADYAPTGPSGHAEPGTLEHFLTERYCLYARRGGRLVRAEIHHAPWSLRPGEARITANTMGAPLGLDLDGQPPLVHYAERLDVVAWLPVPS
jgi:uncharacterized protein